ncbi:MAG: hypothetical protein CW691_08870 [Candidatus Bathyarchaeum sp.]|nr:MAG: hypothetical protein CW691_08870 [Candidatus Bathyarchaeum sp.]
MVLFKFDNKRSGKRGVSPAISTVIMTGAMVAILAVTLGFANNFLWTRVAEGDFNSSKQLMQTVGYQIDDVAWTSGRTETVNYGSQYGDVLFQESALTYNVTVHRNSLPDYVVTAETGALMFVFPTSRYSISNDYFENIFPSQTSSLIMNGTSAPVARVFALEKLPMADGNYIRVVVVPSVRVLNSTIITSGSTTNYIRMYLPVLTAGEAPRLSQSITLTGESLDARTLNDITGITVGVSYDDGSVIDFAFSQFNFGSEENLSLATEGKIVLELYLSEVSVGIGVN